MSVPLGLLAGYAGGWLDGLIMRLIDAMLAIPFLIVAIALAAFLGPSLTNAMIAIGIAALPTFVRLARGTVLAITTEEYVEAARALGLLAACASPCATCCPTCCRRSSSSRASRWPRRSSPRRACRSWGSASSRRRPRGAACSTPPSAISSQAPWMALYPGLMIFAVVMALNVVGDGLRDALDPRVQ